MSEVNATGRKVVSSLPTWATWSIVAAAVLSPILAFLMAIAVEIVVDVLKDAGLLELVALVAAGAIGWALVRKLCTWLRGAAVET
jgi:hypothetical protein